MIRTLSPGAQPPDICCCLLALLCVDGNTHSGVFGCAQLRYTLVDKVQCSLLALLLIGQQLEVGHRPALGLALLPLLFVSLFLTSPDTAICLYMAYRSKMPGATAAEGPPGLL